MYQDQIKKIAYYKERIVHELTKQGIYPNNALVKEKMQDIDSMAAVYQPENASTGEVFDAARFNQDMQNIYSDLKILYQLAYNICIKDFRDLRIYAETHLNQLETMAKAYQYRTALELGSTYLGKTVFYQGHSFNSHGGNGVEHISLGTVNLTLGAKELCVFSAENNISLDNVIFTFLNKNTGESLYCTPYTYNKDMVSIPGSMKTNTYLYTPPDNGVLRSAFPITPEGLKVDRDNTYIIYGGKNQISKGWAESGFVKKDAGRALYFDTAGRITFYIINGSYADFNFNKLPVTKNFNGISIQDMPKHQKITMEYDAGFSMDFTTDGTVYAVCKTGMIQGSSLMYPDMTELSDFLVVEYASGDKIPYEVTVTVNNFFNLGLLRLNAIAIKEINTIEQEGLA